MAGTLNNTQIIPSRDLTTVKSLQIYRMCIPGGHGCAVCVCVCLKCNSTVSVILSFHTSPFISLLLNQGALDSYFWILDLLTQFQYFQWFFNFFFSCAWGFQIYCSSVKKKPAHIDILTRRNSACLCTIRKEPLWQTWASFWELELPGDQRGRATLHLGNAWHLLLPQDEGC